MKNLLLAFLATFMVPVIALAQEVAEVAETVTADFGAIAVLIAPFLVILLGALLYQGIRWVTQKLKVEKILTDEKLHDMLDRVMEEATAYAVSNLKDANWLKIETKNNALGHAMHYVAEQAPELVTKMGIDTNKLQQKLEAKLLKHDEEPGRWIDDNADGVHDISGMSQADFNFDAKQ